MLSKLGDVVTWRVQVQFEFFYFIILQPYNQTKFEPNAIEVIPLR